MKANNTSRRNTKASDDKGEIGIGTMIVFIAAVIVAAIAAAVLINTAGNLERQASETGQETTDEVSANIFVRDIVGHVEDNADSGDDVITSVNFTVSLAPGANAIDFQHLMLQWRTNDTLQDLSFKAAQANADNIGDECSELEDGYCVINVKQADDGDDYSVLAPGDRVHVHVALNNEDGNFEEHEVLWPRTTLDAMFMPEDGTPVQTGFTAPSSFGGSSWIVLK